MSKSLWLMVLAVTAGCGGGSGRSDQRPEPSALINIPVATAALAGQRVAVLPLTLAVPDPSIAGDPLLGSRARLLPFADSLISDAFSGRAPEVTWVLPPELRRAARRAPGFATDPDHLGHAILRDPNFKVVPDPLRSQIRTLVALVDTRFALVPASLVFIKQPEGMVKAELVLVMVDARTGLPGWRSIATATGADAPTALRAALAAVLPIRGVQ